MKKMLAIGIVSVFCLSAAYAVTPFSINKILKPGDKTKIPFQGDENSGADLKCTVSPVGKSTTGTLTALATGGELTIASNPSPSSCENDPSPDERGICVYNAPSTINNMKVSVENDDEEETLNFGFILSPDSSTSYKLVCSGETW